MQNYVKYVMFVITLFKCLKCNNSDAEHSNAHRAMYGIALCCCHFFFLANAIDVEKEWVQMRYIMASFTKNPVTSDNNTSSNKFHTHFIVPRKTYGYHFNPVSLVNATLVRCVHFVIKTNILPLFEARFHLLWSLNENFSIEILDNKAMDILDFIRFCCVFFLNFRSSQFSVLSSYFRFFMFKKLIFEFNVFFIFCELPCLFVQDLLSFWPLVIISLLHFSFLIFFLTFSPPCFCRLLLSFLRPLPVNYIWEILRNSTQKNAANERFRSVTCIVFEIWTSSDRLPFEFQFAMKLKRILVKS